MAAEISKEDRELVESTLNEIPPLWYLDTIQTDDQFSHYISLAKFFINLKHSFQFYFQGMGDDNFDESLTKKEKEGYILCRDYYLAVYNVIYSNWKDLSKKIKSELKRQKLDHISIESPGQAISKIIENDCYAIFLPCTLPYFRFTPSKSREMYKMEKDIKKSDGSNSSREIKKIKEYNRAVSVSKSHVKNLLAFKEFCINFSRENKNVKVQAYLHTYEIMKQEFDKHMQSFFHPRKGVVGHEWRLGDRYQMGKHGGVTV